MHKTAQKVQSMLQPCQLYSELNHIRCIMLLHFHGKEHGKATNPAYTDSDSNQATLCRGASGSHRSKYGGTAGAHWPIAGASDEGNVQESAIGGCLTHFQALRSQLGGNTAGWEH